MGSGCSLALFSDSFLPSSCYLCVAGVFSVDYISQVPLPMVLSLGLANGRH